MQNAKLARRALVTGATGFIGTHLVKQMRREGYSVRVLARKTSNLTNLHDLGVEVFYGDVTEPRSLAGICKEIDYVIHLAAQTESGGVSKEQYDLTNFRGTMNVVEKAAANKVEKFIFISSIAAMGIRNLGMVSPATPCKPNTNYGRSKARAEESLIKKYNEIGFPVVIIRPPTVFGEGEHFNFLALCRQIRHGPYFIMGKGDSKIDFCQVENLVQAIMKSLVRGKPGEVYLIADGGPYTIQEVSETIGKVAGVRINPLHVPPWLAYLPAALVGTSYKVMSLNPPINAQRVRTLSGSFYFDISKAREDLDYRPSGEFEQRVRQVFAWYERNGLL